jgi:hypothetical protein
MSRLLRTGGVLIVDDVFIPSVAVIHRFVTASDDWEQLQILDDQAAVYRMRTPPTPYDYWRIQGINKNFPDYSFLPVGRRIRLTAIARLSSVKWLKSIARRPGVRSVVQRLSR